MRFFHSLIYAIFGATLINALLVTPEFKDVSRRLERDNELFKRKGGGGGGGKGGGSSSGSSSSSSGSSGSSGSSSSGGRSSGSTGTSNVGGATRAGSGTPRSYGGGGYYGGGATTPYKAGSRSPRGIAPFYLLGAGLIIFPGLWLYGAYAYNYNNPYRFYNQSANANQTKPVTCLCQEYSVCGCDENTNSTYLDSIIGNGAYSGLNQSLVRATSVNGTDSIVINGTLPNGTTAPGGTDDVETSAATQIAQLSGYWLTGAIVAYAVWLL